MDEKLNELKEKQQEIGDKISLLQATNKKKDEEAAEIRQLIAECRENLNRIKGIAPGEVVLSPCSEWAMHAGVEGPDGQPLNVKEEDEAGGSSNGREGTNGYRKRGSSGTTGKGRPDDSSQGRSGTENASTTGRAGVDGNGAGGAPGMTGKEGGDDNMTGKDYGSKIDIQKRPCGGSAERKRCAELLAKKEYKPDPKKKKKARDGERVSCKVDLNKMKVRIRGPSEDLKKLDATQLINLLEKFQCQELIINTGDEIIQDPGEIRLVYFLHPGNIVMVAGIIMIAFLINANLCHSERSKKTMFLLNVLYLGSFAFHYGMVLWMTFIRGYALRFGLNHDTFHLVDNIILPKYFSICVLLSAATLYSFLATHCVAPCTSWPLEVLAQMIVVVVTFFMELLTICYVIPALIKLRDATDDYVIDDEEPECSVPDSYEKNLVKLGKLNWTVCLINFLTLIFLGANIYYITSKLNIGNIH